jgi:hypothetical protein
MGSLREFSKHSRGFKLTYKKFQTHYETAKKSNYANPGANATMSKVAIA